MRSIELGLAISGMAFALFTSGCTEERIAVQPAPESAYETPDASLNQAGQALYDVSKISKEPAISFSDIYVHLKNYSYREIIEGKPQLVEIEEFDEKAGFVLAYTSSGLIARRKPKEFAISALPTRKAILVIGEAFPEKNEKNPGNTDFIDKDGKLSRGRILYKLSNENGTPVTHQGTSLYLEKDSTIRKVKLIDTP